MTLEEFEDQYNGAPYDEEQFAQGAEQVIDCEDLSTTALKYLLALSAFRRALDNAGIEMG